MSQPLKALAPAFIRVIELDYFAPLVTAPSTDPDMQFLYGDLPPLYDGQVITLDDIIGSPPAIAIFIENLSLTSQAEFSTTVVTQAEEWFSVEDVTPNPIEDDDSAGFALDPLTGAGPYAYSVAVTWSWTREGITYSMTVTFNGNVAVAYSSVETFKAANASATIASIPAYGTWGDFTIEFWTRITGMGYFAGVVVFGPMSFKQYTTSNSLEFAVYGTGGGFDIGVDFSQWQHMAIVRSGSMGYVYSNGILETSHAVAGGTFDYTAASNFYIGGGNGDGPVGMNITDIRFWKVARTQPEIAANMNTHLIGNEPNLAGNWQMIGGSLADSTANANPMVLLAGASVSPNNPY